MRELSLNVMDIVQNSISAGAKLIEIDVCEDSDSLIIKISDNGCGMTAEQTAHVTDPFFTTRTTRKVGLGIPLFKMEAEMTGGSLEIESEKGAGTVVTAKFVPSHGMLGLRIKFLAKDKRLNSFKLSNTCAVFNRMFARVYYRRHILFLLSNDWISLQFIK